MFPTGAMGVNVIIRLLGIYLKRKVQVHVVLIVIPSSFSRLFSSHRPGGIIVAFHIVHYCVVVSMKTYITMLCMWRVQCEFAVLRSRVGYSGSNLVLNYLNEVFFLYVPVNLILIHLSQDD